MHAIIVHMQFTLDHSNYLQMDNIYFTLLRGGNQVLVPTSKSKKQKILMF